MLNLPFRENRKQLQWTQQDAKLYRIVLTIKETIPLNDSIKAEARHRVIFNLIQDSYPSRPLERSFNSSYFLYFTSKRKNFKVTVEVKVKTEGCTWFHQVFPFDMVIDFQMFLINKQTTTKAKTWAEDLNRHCHGLGTG